MPSAFPSLPRRGPTALIAALAFVLLLAACASRPADDALDRALRSRPVVLLGELHDSAEQHALRARALARLAGSGARPALLMEQFDRERQADLDRALAAPGATADTVIDAAGGLPGWDRGLYRPYVALALERRLPLLAANVSRADARRVVAEGLAALGFEPRVPADLLQAQARAIVQGHCGLIDEAQASKLALAQVARDQFMARLVEAHAARGAVLLAGNGHVRADIGVPRWLAPATRGRSVSVGMTETEQGWKEENAQRTADATPPAPFDTVIAVPSQPRADPCDGLLLR